MLDPENKTITPRGCIVWLKPVVGISLQCISGVEETADVGIRGIFNIHHLDLLCVKNADTNLKLIRLSRTDVPNWILTSLLLDR